MEGLSKMIFVTMHGMNLVRREEILDKLQMDALRAGVAEDAKIEGRRLNHEAHVDDRREANEAWDRMQEP